jgi:hypothetical protein
LAPHKSAKVGAVIVGTGAPQSEEGLEYRLFQYRILRFKKTGMSMGTPTFRHHDLLVRYLIVFLIGYVLFAIHAGADTHKTTITDPVPQIEPGKAKLVDLAWMMRLADAID